MALPKGRPLRKGLAAVGRQAKRHSRSGVKGTTISSV